MEIERAIRSALADEIGRDRYDVWFGDRVKLEVEGRCLRVLAPNQFALDRLRKDFAQPLIEDWVRENRGPEARLKDAAQDLGESLQRLPRLISDVERASSQIARDGLRLDPQSARGLGSGSRDWGSRIALAIAAAALVAAIIALI